MTTKLTEQKLQWRHNRKNILYRISPGKSLNKLSESEVTQSCPTLCDSMDCSPPSSSVHGISQARIPEWVAISFSRGFSRPRDRTWVSRIAGRCFTVWVTKWTNPNNKPATTNPGGRAGVVVCVSHFESPLLYYQKYSIFKKNYVIQERKRNLWLIHWKISLEEAQIWDLLGKHFNLSTINMFKELKEFMKMMSQQIENINKNIQITKKNQIKYWSLKV